MKISLHVVLGIAVNGDCKKTAFAKVDAGCYDDFTDFKFQYWPISVEHKAT